MHRSISTLYRSQRQWSDSMTTCRLKWSVMVLRVMVLLLCSRSEHHTFLAQTFVTLPFL